LCPKRGLCQAKEWYPIFREAYLERTWEEWERAFCNDQYQTCCFYESKAFVLNPSKRYFQSEKVKKVIRILEGKE
jgi:hypothetical protein